MDVLGHFVLLETTNTLCKVIRCNQYIGDIDLQIHAEHGVHVWAHLYQSVLIIDVVESPAKESCSSGSVCRKSTLWQPTCALLLILI